MKRYLCLALGVWVLGTAACMAKPPEEPAPAPQAQPPLEPRIGLGTQASPPPTILLRRTRGPLPPGRQPLYIVDGVVDTTGVPLEINANEVEHIEIVRGQEAVEKYGSRGEHGVVIITTRREREP